MLSNYPRFWSKVQVNKPSDCWPWQGAHNSRGYGSFYHNGKMQGAHRVAYEEVVGVIPIGYELDHLCRTRDCVNSQHLEPVTHRENLLRGNSPSAQAARATHCPQGHEYTEANIYRMPNATQPHRFCIACRKQRDGERYKELKYE